MTCVFHVAPFDGGWCVKICDTGEVLFFKTGGEAERQARRLSALHPGPSEVQVHDRLGRRVGRWIDGASLLEHEMSASRLTPVTPLSLPPLLPEHHDDQAA